MHNWHSTNAPSGCPFLQVQTCYCRRKYPWLGLLLLRQPQPIDQVELAYGLQARSEELSWNPSDVRPRPAATSPASPRGSASRARRRVLVTREILFAAPLGHDTSAGFPRAITGLQCWRRPKLETTMLSPILCPGNRVSRSVHARRAWTLHGASTALTD
ncbi:uncharacterized protein B0I36DRAFT_16139 [Microdochium trichocladiopsis]|uniref:Uncharacterized protein n=1 Tax=Microdochium trichocladiopsis TaxID=1682393 RepID=A0A9P8YI67_9PEZI|nr:uncharacterized protein B0I36DRAFT_16139 [Microdochium trichocladiopsis]KAH7040849.1 hypothetical protein B0I36DRAFT_16139 [Microdochium trichocladiopsis]